MDECVTRKSVINKLKFFLSNPGFFSILIIGDNGVGKEYLLYTILPKENIYSVSSYEIGETIEEISSIFKKEFLIIKDVEQLTNKQQTIMFKLLSTYDGKIGPDDNRQFIRVIFTSSQSIEQLRDNRNILSHFWNRISQLVVKLPSFKDDSSNIFNDFNSVWKKFNFKEYNELPNNGDFRDWLKENCSHFAGNFRDLDKIVILWHQYRIIEYEATNRKFDSRIETKVFSRMKNDFERFTHFPTRKSDSSNIFEFEKGKTWKQIDKSFKSHFKKWAKAEFGTFNNAYKELKMPYRKMDSW